MTIKECPEVVYLDAILGIKPVVIGDNILTEVLQGFRGDKEYKKAKQLLTDRDFLPFVDFLVIKTWGSTSFFSGEFNFTLTPIIHF